MTTRGKDRHIKSEKRRLYLRGYHRRWAWKNKFGISADRVEQMLAEQDGRCAICYREFDFDSQGRGRSELVPHVDHDHQSGKARGLLCNGCNVSIGRMGESIETFERAIIYLRKAKIST